VILSAAVTAAPFAHDLHAAGEVGLAKADALIRWFMPREERFHELFRDDTANLVASARLFREVVACTTLEERRVKVVELKGLEHDGDQATRRIFEALNSTFITPLDREDIRELATDLDDILDYLEGVARYLVLFELEACPPALRQFAEILVEMTESIDQVTVLLWDLKNEQRIHETLVLISDLENRADALYQTVIADLFKGRHEDPVDLLKWKEIYDGLENACDECKNYTHTIGNIVMKNR
jgi:predicted phosphate transport protein (TIGR00153 family)